MSTSLLKLEMIEKSFGAVRALRGVSITVQHGEVLAIVGDNGAGKSTLMKVLSGAEIPDFGKIYFEDKEVVFHSPKDARELGIEMVYQDLSLCDTLNVAQNIFLGREPCKKIFGIPFLDEPTLHCKAQEILKSLSVKVSSTYLKVSNLSGGQRQSVAIARAISFNPRILIMDEPTAALAAREVKKVLDLIRLLKSRDVAVILISHRLQDVLEVADRIVVMYEGRKAAEKQAEGVTLEELIDLIGRESSDGEAEK